MDVSVPVRMCLTDGSNSQENDAAIDLSWDVLFAAGYGSPNAFDEAGEDASGELLTLLQELCLRAPAIADMLSNAVRRARTGA